ncbi:1,3-propanediol dehydrogenase [Pseudobythopirellula maris]|uniref:1,3-propanediol dehydrogenase n=1 Tax=Pseudobythopirellula maris TaxID=2527991 RepID=A0A5C5ZJ14_9BACT|nr:iron-containing alcohol dehydrogenase [Pseudobythopirellula maris]TWT87339.1 1,3-propanediol dehydrogenase [Pseudobythopirellula maris]
MTPFDFQCPTKVAFGAGRIAELGALTAALGAGRVLVVSDPGVIEAGHTRRGVDSLRAAGLDTLIFDGVEENPTTDNVAAGVAVAQDFKPDAIVAIGGGSSMDCAKGINFIHSCGGRMQDYWGVGKATAELLPMAAVPTTAGTGSETQSFALISDAESHVKMACGDKRAAFRVAVLDPELTLTQPPRVTALTGVDAIAHTVETWVTTKRTDVSLAFSRQAWRMLIRGFPRVLRDPADLEARSFMQLGACYAGLAIENSMLGAAHALANPLTAHYGVVHGEAVGLMLPHVVRHNGLRMEQSQPTKPSPYHEMHLFVSYPEASPPEKAIEGLARFLTDLTAEAGLATTLGALGVEETKLPQLAADAAKQWTGTFNPVEMTADDYQHLYEAAC